VYFSKIQNQTTISLGYEKKNLKKLVVFMQELATKLAAFWLVI
jgi:hypothetical protein